MNSIPRKSQAAENQQLFSALSDPTRRSILELLAGKGEMSATEICEHFAMSHPAVSQHLKILRETELVQLEKIAQRRIYRLNPYALNRLGEWLKQMTELWDQRFERLDQVLEKEKRKTRKKAK